MDIAIISYGAGNCTNVKNALGKIGVNSRISESPDDWKKSDAMILPGVGSFGNAMNAIGRNALQLAELITVQRIPFLGICLGMQLLMDGSEESPGVSGLGIISGTAKRFGMGLPVPQIGWNMACQTRSQLFDGLDNFYAYFVHSYYCEPSDKTWTASTSEYGITFASAFSKANIFATQFHPEKSGKNGLKVLENFVNQVKR